MDRDRRLTGYLRGQVDQPTAPAGFELSNGWRVSYTTSTGTRCGSGHITDRLSYRSRSASCKYIQRHPETDDGTLCAKSFPLVTVETKTKKSRISASIIREVAHEDGVEPVQLLCKISRAAIPTAARIVSTGMTILATELALELRSYANFYCAETMRVNDPKRTKPNAYSRAKTLPIRLAP